MFVPYVPCLCTLYRFHAQTLCPLCPASVFFTPFPPNLCTLCVLSLYPAFVSFAPSLCTLCTFVPCLCNLWALCTQHLYPSYYLQPLCPAFALSICTHSPICTHLLHPFALPFHPAFAPSIEPFVFPPPLGPGHEVGAQRVQKVHLWRAQRYEGCKEHKRCEGYGRCDRYEVHKRHKRLKGVKAV